jgi:5-methylcytosine-specific restriction endonuclease McrA
MKVMSKPGNPGPCVLCGCHRDLTFHHLIPRKLHRRGRFRRLFSAGERAEGILICRPCHRGLHRLYDEATLARDFRSRESILSDPALERHIAWSARQKLGPAANS